MFRYSRLAALVLLSASCSFAQTALATVTGTITDVTGAVLANVPVTVLNLDNGGTFRAASSDTGNYTVSQLPIGDYDLTIAAPGFKTYVHAKFHLVAGQTLREDVALEVGAATESVTVTAEATLLQTESSQLVRNITLSQLNNLPLLSVGATNQGFRDPFQAMRMMPGVRYANGTANAAVVNGTPSNSMQVRLDGQTQGATRASLLGATGMTQPSVDAVEEVSILTSNFAAEFGTAGGAVVNMVAKSGTNQFHGSAYDYMTNEALNAHQPYTGLRNKVRQHDWGFTFGGPVNIPKVYDGKNKTFFFWSFEQYRERKLITNSPTSVPIPAYRSGDFSNLIRQENRLVTTASGAYVDPLGRNIQSGTIFDPTTTRAVGTAQVRDPFVGNLIPVSRFDPISTKVLALVPLPFGTLSATQASNNYQAPYRQDRTSNIPSIKVDHNLSAKSRLSLYYQTTSTSTPRSPTGADAFPDLITQSLSSNVISRTARVNYDYTATTRLILHLGLGFNSTDFKTDSPTNNFDPGKELGLTGHTLAKNFPQIVTAVSTNSAIGGMDSLGSTSNNTTFERRPAINFSSTYVMGSHTFKAGAEYRKEFFPDHNFSNTAGTYTFGSNWTQQPSLQGITTSQGFHGYAFASFLMGGLSNATVAAPVVAASTKSQTALYVQDNWKVTRKLTVDYGLRWDYGTYAREKHGRYSSFGTQVINPAAGGKAGGRQFESVCKCNFAANYPYAIGPRIGVSYQLNRKTVIRTGVGIVYNSTSVATGGLSNTAFANAPAAGSGQIVGFFKDGIPAGNVPQWPTTDPAASQAPGSVIAMPFYTDRNAGRPARLLQWNVTVQREISRDLVVEAAYVANRGNWWEAAALSAVNLLSQPMVESYGFRDFTSSTESGLLTTTIANLTTAQRSTLAARGIALPYAGFPTNQTVRQSILPFPQYSGNSVQGSPLGKSWFDSFQIQLTKRYSHGLTFNTSYTFGKTLEQMSATDVFNPNTGKNLGTFDLPHQLRITAQYQIPTLRNSSIGFLANKYASGALSGWGLGVYASYQSAGLVARPASSGTVPILNFLGRGPGSAQQKRDANGNFMNPWSVDWVDYDGVRHTDPIDVNCHCFDPTKTVVLNPAAWENVPNGQWSNSFSSIRSYRGIRFPAENANFSRNFRIKEGINLNVRVEFSNIFNRTQYPGIGGGNFASAPTKFTTGANTGLYSGGFGTLVPTSGTGGMRAGSFVGRITF